YPGTWFRVGFRAPDSAGKIGGMWRYYVISASEAAGGAACASQDSKDVSHTQAGTRVRVVLTPGPSGWCLGRFHGTVTEQEQPACPVREPCPDYVVLIRTVERFTFQVAAQPPGGDATPPVFAGLESAVGCDGGPVGSHRPTISYHLTWKAAHDEVTPRSQIVYDIFMSNSPGGESFSSPTWTSRPGAKSFTTPRMSAAETFYFVVRARDRAGNEDQNRVERQGVDPCV
ncbi:MAG TPA: hypothetical protein VE983_03550, partial [Solirubrobacteraceae bacterium]|nr:hypothetical protein [Solirubrobacteraceae bacterium]